MRYRWKLLLMMLAISIVPMVGLRMFGIHNVHVMAEALQSRLQSVQAEQSRNRIRFFVDGYTRSLDRVREQIEMTLFFQGFQAHHAVAPATDWKEAGPHPSGPMPLESLRLRGFDLASTDSKLCVASPDPAEPKTAADRFKSLLPTHRAIDHHLGDMLLRQHVGLPTGSYSSYPCSNADRPGRDARQQVWYRNALQEKLSMWSRPYPDPVSGRMVMAVSLPLERDDESVQAVIAAVVPLDRLLELALPLSEMPVDTTLSAVVLDVDSRTGDVGARVLLQARPQGDAGAAMAPDSGERWLTSTDPAQMTAVLNDIAMRGSRIRRMPIEDRSAFWAYGPLFNQGTAFMFIVPQSDMMNVSRDVSQAIDQRVDRVEYYTAAFVILLAVLAALLALAFSRTVTRPLDVLTRGAQKLAGGDFDARVDLPSKDEFGEMGRVFNGVGPQLKAHYRVRQALEVAMQIQYNLLPQSAPQLEGLDIRGMSFYSEETGGDYFDYLCVGEKNRQRLCVAVGDVADHGIPSALLMATARALIRQRAAMSGELGDIVSDVNQRFSEDVERSGRFMTLFLARIDRDKQRIEWVRAGHDPALLYDPRTDAFTSLQGRGMPLGVDAGFPFRASATDFHPGQVLFIGSDGIWETRNPAGGLFGKERLQQVIRRYADQDARTIMLSIFDAVEDFRQSSEQEDDITLVVVKMME